MCTKPVDSMETLTNNETFIKICQLNVRQCFSCWTLSVFEMEMEKTNISKGCKITVVRVVNVKFLSCLSMLNVFSGKIMVILCNIHEYCRLLKILKLYSYFHDVRWMVNYCQKRIAEWVLFVENVTDTGIALLSEKLLRTWLHNCCILIESIV